MRFSAICVGVFEVVWSWTTLLLSRPLLHHLHVQRECHVLADDLPAAPTELVCSFGFDKGEKFGFGGDFADNASLKSDTASIRGDKADARTQSGGPLSRRVLFHTPIVLVEASFMHLILLVGCCYCHEHLLWNPMKLVHIVGL